MKEDANSILVEHGVDAVRNRFDVAVQNGPAAISTAVAYKPPVTKALRSKLLVSTWLTLNLPPRDYLLGNVLCTTSRWLIFGETGETYDGSDCGSSYISTFLPWADANGVGYEAWTWDTWGGCGVLISDYDGTPADAWAQWVQTHYLSR